MQKNTKFLTVILTILSCLSAIICLIYEPYNVSVLVMCIIIPLILCITSLAMNNNYICLSLTIFTICSSFTIRSSIHTLGYIIFVILSFATIILGVFTLIFVSRNILQDIKNIAQGTSEKTKKYNSPYGTQISNSPINSNTEKINDNTVVTAYPTDTSPNNKQIVKTKILETKEQETAASKKKGKWLSALSSGLSAGTGGGTYGAMFAGHAAGAHHERNKNMETVVTFLVIYNDSSREVIDTIKGDNNYNNFIMYLE